MCNLSIVKKLLNWEGVRFKTVVYSRFVNWKVYSDSKALKGFFVIVMSYKSFFERFIRSIRTMEMLVISKMKFLY